MHAKSSSANIEQLRGVLLRVREKAGSDFSGVGIIVYRPEALLPICPLRSKEFVPKDGNLVHALAEISSVHSDFHDGFHLISNNWRLTHVSQYFSPPIVAGATIDRSKLFGGRYLAALFGSALPGVDLTGVASNGFGLAIFQSGAEVFFEQFQ